MEGEIDQGERETEEREKKSKFIVILQIHVWCSNGLNGRLIYAKGE